MTKTTPLYSWHQQHGAKMVEFGGYLMPVSYEGVLAEHAAVRRDCGLFDISHMGEIYLEGKDAGDFVQYLTTNDVRRLQDHQAQYSLLLNEQGFALDDVLVYRLSPQRFMLCVNAANVEKDFQWILSQKKGELEINNQSESIGMIALQGPKSASVLQGLGIELKQVSRFETAKISLAGAPALLSRTGYTGEDGCEFFMESEYLANIWETLWKAGQDQGLKAVGLGARDTLRLEMGYVLYGHELNDNISPWEAGLSWVLKIAGNDFIGREAIVRAKEAGISREVLGLVMGEAGIPRQGMKVLAGGRAIGEVCSGTQSPSLKKGIATALLEKAFIPADGEISIDIRGKMKKAKIVKPPFIIKN